MYTHCCTSYCRRGSKGSPPPSPVASPPPMQGFAHTLLITLSERGCMNWPKDLPKPGAGSEGGGAHVEAGGAWGNGMRGHHRCVEFAGALATILHACIASDGLLLLYQMMPACVTSSPYAHVPSHPACTAPYPCLLVPPDVPASLHLELRPEAVTLLFQFCMKPPDLPHACFVPSLYSLMCSSLSCVPWY